MPMSDPGRHIVQIGFDQSVFTQGITSETAQRQIKYGQILERLRPGTLMTLLIITDSRREPLTVDNVTFKPFYANRRGIAKLWAWYQLYKALGNLHREHRIDVVTTQTINDEAWIGLLFSKRYGCASVGQIHNDLFSPDAQAQLRKGAVGWLRLAIIPPIMHAFTAIRVVSTGNAKKILSRGMNNNVHVIPVTMTMVSQSAPPLPPTHRQKKVLFVGRLVGVKNLGFWLRVTQRILQGIPNATFQIVGNGVLRNELEARAATLGIASQVEFSGFIPYAQLPNIYQSASVFLITSLYEGFGRVIAEALVNRLPVVAPHISGIEDIVVDGQSGYLVPPHDVEAFAKAVIDLLSDPAKAEAMGAFGEKDVKERFDADELAEKWMRLLIDTAEQYRTAHST